MNTTLAKYFGGGAGYAEGKWTAPSFKVKTVKDDGSDVEENSYASVAEAFEGVGTSFEKLHKEVTKNNTEVTENIKQNALLWSDEDKAFVAQHEKDGSKTNSKIKYLANGEISEHSTEAVTGGQLYSMNKTVARYFGGGAGYNDKGEWVAPSFKLKTIKDDGTPGEEKSYDNVAEAFADVGTSFTNIKNDITNVVSDSLVKQDDKTKIIKIGGEKDGSAITIADKDSKDRTLSGVKKAENDNEAVNKGQFDEGVTKLSQDIDDVRSVAVFYDTEEDADDVRALTRSARKVNKNSVTFGDPSKGQVGLHNVADGKIAKDSHDVINGNQIDAISQDLAKFLGGDAAFSDGTFTEPTYKLSHVAEDGKVTDSSYTDVGSAFAGLDTSVKNVNQRIKDVSESVAQDSLNWSKDKGAFVAQHGEGDKKANSKITSLAVGDIGKDSTDAVTGGQLYSLGSSVAKSLGGNASYENGAWTAPSFKVKTVKEDGSEVEEKSYESVADAFEGVGNSFKNLQKEVTQGNTEVTENIKQNALLWSETDKAFVAQHGKDEAKTNSKIKYLANGDIGENSTEAVNGSQLYSLNTTLATYFGGDAKYEDGKWTAPKFTVKTVKDDGSDVEEKSYESVAEAFKGVGTSFTNIHNEVKNEIDKVVSDSLVKQDDKTHVISIGSEKSGTSINIANTDHATRTLSGVKEGSVSEESTDAINGSQLYSLNTTLATYFGGGAKYEDGAWTAPSFKVKTVKEDGSDVEEQSYESVAEAFKGVGTSFTNIHNEVKNEIDKVVSDSLVKQDEKTHVISIGGEKSGTSINIANTDHATRTLSGVKEGSVSEESTDAINGSQLYSLNTTLAKYFGGGAGYAEGKWTAPNFKVKTVKDDGSDVEENSYESVAAAFEGVGTSFEKLHKEVTQNNTDVTENIKQNALLWSDEDKAFVAQHGKDGSKTNSKIKYLANGEISENSTEAINGSQLYSLNQTLATYFGGDAKYEDGQWSAPTFKVTTFKDDGSSEEQSYSTVAEAFAGVSSSFTKLHNEISENIEQNALLWSDEDKAFVAVHGKGDKRSKSKLKSLLDGDISEGSTEAITGNQLYSMSNALAAYFGGGAGYKDGEWRAPEFKVAQFKSDGSSDEKKSYNDVASAFDGVSESMTSINGRIQDVEKNVSSNSLNWNEEQGSYDASHKGEASKITNVLDGKIAENSQEVVNGGQLWTTNEKVKKVEERVDTLDQHVQDIASAVTDGAVNYDKDADGKKTNKITLAGGDPGEPVMIDNVADGKIEAGSKQAVNGGQLHDYTKEQMALVLDDAKKYTDEQVNNIVTNGLNEAKSYTDMKFEALSYGIEDVRKEARQAAAIGLAVSNLRYYDIPGSLSVSFGSGIWRSQSAFAIGAGYTSEDGNIRSNLSITSAGGHWGVGAGITLRLR
ncbi:Vomp family autotransporter [Bartonella gliris]|uniref:Vomp family autotransporter n=1 Tax=Bartonella gliris TaxID=3004109 RepID=UPI003872BD34